MIRIDTPDDIVTFVEAHKLHAETFYEAADRLITVALLRRYNWHQGRAADHAGISNRMMFYKAKNYSITKADLVRRGVIEPSLREQQRRLKQEQV